MGASQQTRVDRHTRRGLRRERQRAKEGLHRIRIYPPSPIMPPKKAKQDNAPKKPAVDKTFGMKNKKGAKGQAAVALAKQQQSQVGRSDEVKKKEKEREQALAKKKAEELRKQQNDALYSPVQVQQKVPFGVDPKTVLCINFKNGRCDRGNRCKFAHDLEVGRKVVKKDLYTDSRDEDKAKDTMENWTEEKLREVVESKMGGYNPDESGKGKNTQDRYDIVCKYFIDAIENSKYGWFWECPNGGTQCKYRHALPPGFVLKSQRKKDEEAEKAREISLDEFLEVERHKLSKDKVTPVTKETFEVWKKTRLDKKTAEAESVKKSKELQAQAGKSAGMSGRDLFTYNPLLLEGDSDDEGDDWDIEEYRRQAAAERDEEERKRMQGIDGDMANASLDDHSNGTNGAS